jgi:hypothetical protein
MLGFRRRHDTSPSIFDLAKKLVSDASRLVRVEVDLVKARFSRTAKHVGVALGITAGGAPHSPSSAASGCSSRSASRSASSSPPGPRH